MPDCPVCGREHVASRPGARPCMGHISTGPKGQPIKDNAGQPCRKPAMIGLDVCASHGGRNPAAKAAGQRRAAEAKAAAAVTRRLGDSGDPVTDPISKLCAIAGRAVAFMEALGTRVDQLDDQADRDQARAEIAVYGRSIKDAAGVVESIIRMGIAERLAKVEEEQTAAIVKFIDGVLTDLGHNPRAPEVAGVVARRLELVS